jgi:hypothetical protein
MRSRISCPLLHLLASGCLAAIGCSDDGSTPPPADTGGIEARFSFEGADGTTPRFLEVPFPSDAYLEPDGTVVDTLPGFDTYVRQNAAVIEGTLATQRGFGLNAGAFFVIDRVGSVDEATGEVAAATIDPASLPATREASIADDSSIFLVDLDAEDASVARVPCRAGYHDDRDLGSIRRPVLTVLPARGVVLREGRRYAVVLTTRVTADGGRAIAPSATFRDIRDGARRSGPLDQLYGDAVDRVAALVPPLADRNRIAALTTFTTQATSRELVAMRTIIAELPPPPLQWEAADLAPMHAARFAATPLPGYTATLDEWLGAPGKLPDGTDDPAADQATGAGHDALAAIATAAFDAPNFLRERSGGYDDPEHATVARDAAGDPILDPERPTAKGWITIALPKGPVPTGGFPVIILQHGLQSDRSFLLTMANTFAKRGWASVAIDAVTFGARATSEDNTTDLASVFAWSSSAGYSGPDGLVDQPADALSFFGRFVNFGAPRDQLRQAAVDIGTVAEIVRDPALDLGPLLSAVPGAQLDGERIAYVGDSFGSLVGAMVAAVEPRVQAMVLNVGGGGVLTEIVANAPALGTILGTLAGVSFGLVGDRFTEYNPVLNMLQLILDAADPLTHARGIVLDPPTILGAPNPPKSVVLVEVLWDELISNEGTEALALAAGMPLAAPHVGPNGGVELPVVEPVAGVIRGVPVADATAVLVQASPATHGSNLYSAMGRRHYRHPFGATADRPAFTVLPGDIPVRQPYLGLQSMMVELFAGSFAGEVPAVSGFPAPVRDFDDDGVEDSSDPDPNDPQ